MLNELMNLKTMLDIKADDGIMALLDLDVTCLCKGIIVSKSKTINYQGIKDIFTGTHGQDLNFAVKNLSKTVFYDFDSKVIDHEKFITIFELNFKTTATETIDLLSDILLDDTSDVDIVFEVYTHDSKITRISRYDGTITKTELK